MKKALLVITGVLFTVGIYLYFSSEHERLRDNIYYQNNGYELTLIEDDFPLEFEFEEQWLKLIPGEFKEINKVLLTRQNSTVILKRVFREESTEDYGVELDVKQNFQDSNQGMFLSTMKIERNSFTSNGVWTFKTTDGKELDSGMIRSGGGSGPSELIWVRMSSSQLENIVKPFIIKYTLHLYRYDKN